MPRFSSIFSQLLQLFPIKDLSKNGTEFEQAVREHKAEYQARGFSCWGRFVAMLYCQLGRVSGKTLKFPALGQACKEF